MSEKAGVQRLNFDIAPPVDGPSLSDVVLVRKVDSFHAGDDPDEPLIFEKGKVTPNVVGDVPVGAKSVSLFFIVHPDAELKDPVKVEMEAVSFFLLSLLSFCCVLFSVVVVSFFF